MLPSHRSSTTVRMGGHAVTKASRPPGFSSAISAAHGRDSTSRSAFAGRKPISAMRECWSDLGHETFSTETMSLNIKREEPYPGAGVARLTGESVTEAVTTAVQERLDRVRRQRGVSLADSLVAIVGRTARPTWRNLTDLPTTPTRSTSSALCHGDRRPRRSQHNNRNTTGGTLFYLASSGPVGVG
jgi:antitoxin VapB